MCKYTHKGWFGMCPIYIDEPFSQCPGVTARHPLLMGWLKVNIWLQQVSISFCSMMFPDWEPSWKIRLTGTLP